MVYACMLHLYSLVETPRKFIIAKLSIRKLGSSSVLIIIMYGKMCSSKLFLKKPRRNVLTYKNYTRIKF